MQIIPIRLNQTKLKMPMFNRLLGGPGKIWREKDLAKTRDHVFILLRGSLNNLWEWSRPSLGRGHCLAGSLGGRVWTKATLQERKLMLGAGVKPPGKQ